MARADLVFRLCRAAGKSTARVIESGDGWPSITRVRLSKGTVDVAMYVGRIHSMSRKPNELRFQNPGQGHPIEPPARATPLLVGFRARNGRPVMVVPEVSRRVDHPTRFSVLLPAGLVQDAEDRGWAEPYISTSGEVMYAFHPALLPTYLEMVRGNVKVAAKDIAAVLVGAELLEDQGENAKQRARRATSTLVRNARFGKAVMAEYGERCAMCGLDLDLAVGAHIYPVRAPSSPDRAWNGLALCPNHHAAFDNHQIWIHPHTHIIRIDPELSSRATDDVSKRFLATTYTRLRKPRHPKARPRATMLDKRYQYFEGHYEWVTS